MPDLKPCPVCGGEPEPGFVFDYKWKKHHWLMCTDKDHKVIAEGLSEEETRENWNRKYGK